MNRRSPYLVGLSLTLAACGATLAACGGATKAALDGKKIEGSAAPTSTKPADDAAPVASGEPKAEPQKAPEPAPAPEESPFHVAVTTDSEMDLHAVGDVIYVMDGDFVGEVVAGSIKPVVAKDFDEKTGDRWGLPSYGGPIAFGGARGDSPIIIFITDNGRVGYNLVFQRRGHEWRKINSTSTNYGYAGMTTWKDGRTLGLRVGISMNAGLEDFAFEVIAGSPAAAPKLTKGEGPCLSKVIPLAIKAFPSGEVFAVGAPCAAGKLGEDIVPTRQDKLVVERWAAGQTKGQIDELPLPEGAVALQNDMTAIGFTGASASDLYLNAGEAAKEPRLLHFDGKAWSLVDSPSKSEMIRSFAPGPEGSLFAIAGDVVYKKPAEKAWEELALPKDGGPLSPTRVVSLPSGAVWLAASADSGGALLTTGAPPARVEKEKLGSGAGKRPKYVLPKAATSKCATNFAMLYAFTKVTPDNYDFPLTRQAIKGKKRFKDARFVVVEENGRKYFGVILPNYALGKALVDEIEKEVKGAKPALLCYEPKVVRELKLNIETGEPIP